MDACAMGAWRPAYRLSEARRHVRAELVVRDALVRRRWLLVEAAWQILRSKSPETAALRARTVQIAQRRGKRGKFLDAPRTIDVVG